MDHGVEGPSSDVEMLSAPGAEMANQINKSIVTWTLNIISFFCAAIVVWQFTHKALPDPPKDPNEARVGSKISVSGVSWKVQSPTLVLALSAYCPYCRASAAFYRSLADAGRANGLHLVAVFREPASVFTPIKSSFGIENISEVREGNFGQIGVSATPTVLLVNEKGIVQDLWRGQLSPSDEKQMLARVGLTNFPLNRPALALAQVQADTGMVGAQDLKKLMADPKNVVLDTRKREEFQKSHIRDSLNIPYDEVVIRAPHELPRQQPVILFCRFCAPCEAQKESEGTLSFCTFSDQILRWAGFDNVRHISDDLDTLAKNGVAVTGDRK